MDKKLTNQITHAIRHEPEAVIKIIVESDFWPKSLSTMTSYERGDDETKEGSLSVMFGDDGDAHAMVMSIPDKEEGGMSHRFRTYFGGGKSLRTYAALKVLAVAMELDNKLPRL